jgi:hypothetical protein
MIHTTADAYTTFAWARFSQDALKQLSANPKIKPFVEPFIEPTATERPPKPEIKVNPGHPHGAAGKSLHLRRNWCIRRWACSSCW